MSNCEDIPFKAIKGKLFVRVWHNKEKKLKLGASGVRKSRWRGTFFQNFQKNFSHLRCILKSSFNAIAAILNFAKKIFIHYPTEHALFKLYYTLVQIIYGLIRSLGKRISNLSFLINYTSKQSFSYRFRK